MAFGFDLPAIDDHLDHLTAYWKMEETGAAARLDSVGSNDAAAGAGNPDTRAGVSNLAYDGDGDTSNDSLLVPNHADIEASTSVAISLWLYRDNTTKHMRAFQKTTSVMLYQPAGNNSMVFYIYQDDSASKGPIDAAMTTGAWHNVVCIADDGFVRVYVDNSESGTPVAYDNTIDTDLGENLRIGSVIGGTNYEWDGGIDEMGYWKDISFADQEEREAFVAGLWNGGAGRFYGEYESAGVVIGPIQTGRSLGGG